MKSWLSILLLLVLFTPATGVAQSPGRKLLHELIEAYNADDRARMDAYRERYGLKVETDEMLQLRDDSGPLRVLRIDRTIPPRSQR